MIGRTSPTQKTSPLSTATQRAPVVPRRVLTAALLVAGTALYWSLYRFVPFFHEGHILHTTLFFAGAAGYFLGFRAGFAASIAGLALHTVILNELGHPGWGAIARYAPGLHAAILLVGPAMGRLRTAQRRLGREIELRRHMEASLRASELHYRSLVECMSEGVWQLAVDGTILFVNEQLCRLTGYAPRELVGRGLREVFAVEEFAPLFAEETDACARGDTSSRRLPLRTRHGEVRWCQLSGAATRDLDGRLVGRVGVLSDVTEQARAEARADDERHALVESEARFRQLADHIDAIFWISTADRTRMIYISPAFDRIMGRARKAMYDDPRAVVAWTHPEDRERLSAALDAPPEEDYELEYRILLPGGALRWLHSRAFTVRDDAGDIHRIAGLTADVTARKAVEEALLESEERLRAFVEHAPAAVAMLDQDMCYVAASRRWREDYGLESDDLTGRSHDAVFPETPERWKRVYQRCLRGAVEHCDEDPVVRA
ncbi:MAG: PAS domain S-box protein, partial [Candidatus Krumholzibacteria bacterium]|nr:PAS domain S-box protein [Candidatus Krumholzibacteria bacterium]